jgi:hypothetical protein
MPGFKRPALGLFPKKKPRPDGASLSLAINGDQ